MANETIHSLDSSRNHTGNDAIDNVDNYVKEWWRVIRTVKDYEKLSEQYNKMLEERNSLIDDLSWYKAKVSRLERENEKLRSRLDEFLEHDYDNQKLYKENRNLLSEISQHIGKKPSSNKYKYFRVKLDSIGIEEGD